MKHKTFSCLPLLGALLLGACDRDATVVLPTVAQETGSISPRLVSSSGKLDSAKFVSVTVWYRPGDTAAELVKRKDSLAWKDHGVRIDSIPVGSSWRMQVAAWNAPGDTVWKGLGSGTVKSASDRARLDGGNDSGTVVLVKGFATAPTWSVKGYDSSLVVETLTVGDTLMLSGGAHLSLGEGAPAICDSVAGASSLQFVLADSLLANGAKLYATSCKEGSWSTTALLERKVRPRPVEKGVYDSVAVPTECRGDTLSWNRPVSLMIPRKDQNDAVALVWSAKVDTSSQVPNGTEWTAMGVPSVSSKDGLSGGDIDLSEAVRYGVTSSSLYGRVLVKAVAYRNDVPLDTLRLWWHVSFPAPEALQLVRARDTGTIRWTRSRSGIATLDSAANLGNASAKLALVRGVLTDSVVLSGLAGKEAVSLRLRLRDTLTRRTRDTVVRDTALNPPVLPQVSAINSVPDSGVIAVARPVSDTEGSEFFFAVSDTGVRLGSQDINVPLPFATLQTVAGKPYQAVASRRAGIYRIWILAVRDSVPRWSSDTLRVRSDKLSILPNPTGLALLHRTDSSLTWRWDSLPRQRWMVVRTNVGNGKSDTVASQDSARITVDGLKPGAQVQVAVFALPVNAGDRISGGTYSAVARTRLRPLGFSMAWDDATRTLSWNDKGGLAYSWKLLQNGTLADSGRVVSGTSQITAARVGLLSGPVYTLLLWGCNADSLCTDTLRQSGIQGNFGLQPPSKVNLHLQGKSLVGGWAASSGATGYSVSLLHSKDGTGWSAFASAKVGELSAKVDLPDSLVFSSDAFQVRVQAYNDRESTLDVDSAHAALTLPGALPADSVYSVSPSLATIKNRMAPPSGWSVWGRSWNGSSWSVAQPFVGDTLSGTVVDSQMVISRWFKSADAKDSSAAVQDTVLFSTTLGVLDYCTSYGAVLPYRCEIAVDSARRLSYRYGTGYNWNGVDSVVGTLRRAYLSYAGGSQLQLRVQSADAKRLPTALAARGVHVAPNFQDKLLDDAWAAKWVTLAGVKASIDPSSGTMTLTTGSAAGTAVFNAHPMTGLLGYDVSGAASFNLEFVESPKVVPQVGIAYGTISRLSLNLTYPQAFLTPVQSSTTPTKWVADLGKAVDSKGTSVASSNFTSLHSITLNIPAQTTWVLTKMGFYWNLKIICISCLTLVP